MDDIPDFLKRLQNKITYYVYKTVNDDAANEYAKKKQDASNDEKEVKEVKENYNSTLPVLKQPTDNGIDIDRILSELYEYFLLFVKYVLYPLLCIYLSSLVANDLIVYPVGVRAVFFVLILFLCASFVHVTIGMSLFYTGRKLYEKYLNRERDDKPNPPIKLMPKIFAMLPISTKTSDSSFYNFFMYPFRYLKDVNSEKENTFLKELMKKYTDSLNESFPYYQKVKGDTMFVSRKEELDKEIAEMHTIVRPKKVEAEANASNASKEASLPPTIQELENKKKQEAAKSAEASLPPTIQELENKKKQEANKSVNKPANKPAEASLPPTIQELENKKKQEAAKSAEASLPPTIQELENKKKQEAAKSVNKPQEAPLNKPVNQQEAPINQQEPVNKPLTEPVPPKI